jgi:hypothetical protein
MAVVGFDVRTLFDGTLTITDGHMFQSQIVTLKKRTFALKMLIAY